MARTKVITVKMTETELLIADQLADLTRARSRSDVLREALLALARVWKLLPDARRKVTLERMTSQPRRNRKAMATGFDNRPPCGPLEPGRAY